MSNPLTVGMACYKDFDGVYFTVQALRAYHGDWFDIVVVDNTPDRQPNVAAVVAAVGGEYHHRPDLTGTSAPRDAVFKYAKTPWVMCVDSHVLLEQNALRSFRSANTEGPSLSLYTGPLVHDDGRGLSTHWRPTTEPGLWGVWDTDQRIKTEYVVEIPMQGLGLFAMRKDAWVGMHPLSRGFGGEEGYVHEKVRRAGGKNLCLKEIGWRHRFRDVGGWESNPTPYPVHLGDHVWNLLVQHRELGIDALDAIYKDFGSRLPKDHWERLVDEAILKQPWNEPCPTPKPQRVLCVWYSDNTAPEPLLHKSLSTVAHAAAWVEKHGRHTVDVVTIGWENLPLSVGRFSRFNGTRKRSHGGIIEAIRQALATAGSSYDVVCLMEHDVLYPEGYIVKVADAFGASPKVPVVSNLNYIGLSGQGWQPVKERHEAMHQLSMRLDVLRVNLELAWNDFRANGSCLVEPQGDRADWIRLPFETGLGLVPAVHVNHQAGRFTSHGEVCYARATVQRHGYWGEHKDWWPHAVVPVTQPASGGGCSSCGQPLGTQFPTLAAWYESAKKTPSDFHEHMDILKKYADQCETVAEVVAWDKPSTVALCASKALVVHSYSVSRRRSWDRLVALSEGRLVTHESRNGFPPDYEFHGADLVFLDTQHNAAALFPLLEAFRGRISRYIVVHCTDIYGQTGNDNSPGVLYAIRRFLHDHKDWVAIERLHNNYGLVVLSRVESDRKQPPGFLRKALNYTKALAKDVAAASQEVPDEVWEARVDECLMCPERALDACAICGCPVEAKAKWAEQACPANPPRWSKYELPVVN